jgi:serine/threonine protein kinase
MNQTFGRYTVVGQLGRGAMGVVYLAMDPMLNRQVAVKTVDLGVDDPAEREFLRSRLLRDARAAAVLKHPNIVGVHDVFEDGDRAYVVMEYVEGDTLAAYLKAHPLPDAQKTLNILRQMAEALDYTHSRGVIHRDIKPANVMIDAAGTAKIMDFGIARITDARTCTPTGMVMGTVEYMAPEQIRGEAVDGRADQFALASVAYQMMTGSTLFGPHTMATLTYKIVNEAPLPPRTRNAALPPGVDAVLAKALSKTPSERFASCSEFVNALADAFATPATTRTVAPVIPISPPVRSPKRRASAVPVLVVALLAAGGALAVWKPWSRTAPPPEHVAESKPAVAPPVTAREPADPTPAASRKPAPHKATPNKAEPAPPPSEPPSDSSEVAELLPPPAMPKSGAAPTPFETATRRGQEQLKSKDYPGALESFTKAIGLRPKFAPAYFSRGVAHQNLEQNELAIQDFAEAVHLAPGMAPAYTGRGLCLVRLKRDPDALLDFQHALELKPDLAPALRGRAGIYLRREQYRMALADFDAAIKTNPQFVPAYFNRARVREALGDLRGAADDRREGEARKR